MNPVKNRMDEILFVAATERDFEDLLAFRILAMQESLERIGRFSPERARERFLLGFEAQFTRHILLNGERVGFLVVKPSGADLHLDHFYIHPRFQRSGIGAAVLTKVFEDADNLGLPVRTGALRDSESNEFYLRHGFVKVKESEWDIHYIRPCRSAGNAP